MNQQHNNKNEKEVKPKPRALIYIRHATTVWSDERGIDLQRERCQAAAEKLRLAVIDIYADRGRGAGRFRLRELLGRLDEEPGVGYVIAADRSRLGTDPAFLFLFDDALLRRNVQLIVVDELAEAA